jgi:ubiquinone/menaquinone biosynthesis C-methylase UbiE
MRRESVIYWNAKAARSNAEARDAVLCGFRTEAAFDEAGREDARHLILPFVSAKDVVLDVGCGLGRLLKWAAPACREAIGLDISAEMLKRARVRLQELGNVRLKRLPLSLRFPVPDRSVDFAYFYHVSEHVDREDTFTILTEMRRCLRRSGIALVQFSLLEHQENRHEFLKWVREGDAEGVRSRFYSEPEALVMLQMAQLYPQHRLYIPGEFAVIVTKSDDRGLGHMPLVPLAAASSSSRE